jgi:hypothetical protein
VDRAAYWQLLEDELRLQSIMYNGNSTTGELKLQLYEILMVEQS